MADGGSNIAKCGGKGHIWHGADHGIGGSAPALDLEGDRTLPFDYVLVREDGVPMYGNEEEVRGETPRRSLTSGMSLAAGRTRDIDGEAYLIKGEIRLEAVPGAINLIV